MRKIVCVQRDMLSNEYRAGQKKRNRTRDHEMPKEEVQKEYSARKQEFASRLQNLLANNSSVLIINADNVGSQSMHVVRAELRKGPRATILMGKNTMIKYVIKKYANDSGNQSFNKLADLCKLNVGLVFTNDDLKDVRDVLEKNKV